MIKDNDKGCCRLPKCCGCKWLWIVAVAVVVLIVSFAVTADLPWKRVYEARYEFRVRNFRKNVEGVENVMRNMDVVGSYGLCRYLETLPVDDGLSRTLKYDNTEKITLCVRGGDRAAVAQYAARLYSQACDTMQRFGDTMCVLIADALRREIDSLPETLDDSLMHLRNDMYNRLIALEADNAGGAKYMDLLNGSELPQAKKTPSRACVIVLAMLAYGLLVLGYRLLALGYNRRKGDDEGC